MRELKFDGNLGFQREAIQAITDVFRGQKVCPGNFSVRRTETEVNLGEEVLAMPTAWSCCQRRFWRMSTPSSCGMAWRRVRRRWCGR